MREKNIKVCKKYPFSLVMVYGIIGTNPRLGTFSCFLESNTVGYSL